MTRSRAVGAAVAILLVALLAWGYHWWTHPTLLQGGTSSFKFSPRPLAGGPSYAGIFMDAAGVDETIVLTSVTAELGTNTARATASFSICESAGDRIGSADGEDLNQYCDRIRPVEEGAKLKLGSGADEYVVIRLTPTRPGRVTVKSVTLDYSRSWRHLHQHGKQTLDGGLVDQVR